MLIFEKNGLIKCSDNKTNIFHEFVVPSGTNELIIYYSYSPKTVEDSSLANKLIEEGKRKYDALELNNKDLLPVKNLVTLSFDECKKYRGACHRQANEQIVRISDKNSTPGIFNRPIEAGIWDVCLNVHFVGCEVNYSLKIEAKGDWA